MELDESPPFVIGTTQTLICGDPGAAAKNFACHRAIACVGALEPSFLAKLLNICNQAQFVADAVENLGHREVETPAIAGGALTLALQRSNLLRWIEAATHCGSLRSASGRVVQALPGGRDQLVWHNDMSDMQRRLAITINLTEQPYEGGTFELRSAKSTALLLQHRHLKLGSVLIFDIGRSLEHRILPLISGGPRRIYTGWFLKGDAQ